MEEVSFDFEVIGRPRRTPRCSTCCRRDALENVEQRQASVQAAGSCGPIVDVEAFALENACRLLTHQMPDGGMDRNIAVIDFGAISTTFSVLRDLKVHLHARLRVRRAAAHREIMRTYGLSMEEAGRPKKEGGLPANYQAEVLDPFIDDMCQQVSRSLQFYLASGSGAKQRAGADLRRLREHPGRGRRDREPVGIPAERGDPLGQMKIRPARSRRASRRMRPRLLTAAVWR